jgi:hypothetical protein
MVLQRDFGTVDTNQFDKLIEAPPGQAYVVRMKFRTRDDPWLAKGRQSHGLCAIELRILEGCEAYQSCCHRGWQIGSINVNLIGDNDADFVREVNTERLRRPAPRRSHAPWLVGILVFDRHADAQHPAAALCIGDNRRCRVGGEPWQ